MKMFGRKKKLEKQLAELALQKQQQEQAQRWNELQMQEQLRIQDEEHRRKEQQWEMERQERSRLEYEQRELARQQQKARDREEIQRREREARRRERLKQTTPEALRGLRDLIRTRYQLDMEIWSLKGARGPDRPVVLEKMERADSVLMEIYTMVETWEENEKIWTAEEWRLAKRVREQVMQEGKRLWENNPPWNET
ncbi:hypothetical protein BDZ45DRAFT_363427 [Acephala macrosclerotiorum]|nr:hypothetical protein BDZ45DRAFT_363427 [Acephala macrosclerotiorum]